MFRKVLAGSARVLMLVITASACLGIAALPAGAVAATEGVPETLGVQNVGDTAATVLGAVQVPAKTDYQFGAEYALASETWCTTHGASGTPSKTIGGESFSMGVRETFSASVEALLPEHEYCAAVDVTVESAPTASGEQKTFTTLPVVASAPRWFINGIQARTKHEGVVALGPVTLHNGLIENIKCEDFFAGSVWNEVQGGTERAFGEITGYVPYQCEATLGTIVTNERGVEKEGVFLTAEGPPEAGTEKARKTGSTSLPWSGELTEKEAQFFDTIHHMEVWAVYPLCTEMGGTGRGEGCRLQGNEIPFEEREGPTEKAAGDEAAFKCVNGTKNGLSPSKVALEGEKEGTEKGKPETGRLESGFGPGYLTGSLVFAGGGFGGDHFELIACKHPYFGR